MTQNLVTDKRILRTRQALTTAFLSLSEEMPVTDISVHAIVTKAGYSRGAFYKHYNTKQDFLLALLNTEAEIFIQKSCRVFTDHGASYEKKLHDAGMDLFTNIYNHRQLYKLIFTDALFFDSRNTFFKVIREGVMNLYQNSSYQTSAITQPELYIYANTGWYFSIIDWWISQDFELSPKAVWEFEYAYKHRSL